MRIFDNSKTRKDEFTEVENLVDRIKDKTLASLEKDGVFVFPSVLNDTDDLTKDQKILSSSDDFFCTQNVMGFLGLNDERLIISSRFCKDESNKEREDFFLQYLLSRVFDIPNLFDLPTGSNSDLNIFELLAFIFPYYLKEALRKGLFKTYIRREYNDFNVKGTIDFARHIKLNTPFTGRIACSQREFSEDNILMELIRHTIEFIKVKPYGRTILNKVKDECRMVIEATPRYQPADRQKIIHLNRHKVVRHTFYREYKNLQNLCIQILTHQKKQFSSNTDRLCGVLFDGAWLWEEYINILIKDRFYHPMNKAHNGNSGCQRLFSDDEGGKTGLIYPDFISKDTVNRVIGDAKYKPIDNIGNKDYLQVLAYMFRFDAKTGFYFYPEQSRSETESDNSPAKTSLYLNSGCTFERNVNKRENPEIRVTKLGLRIPNVGSYKKFVGAIKSNETLFSNFI